MQLWHYTCDHDAADIRRSGLVLPNERAATVGMPVVAWLTDLDIPDRAALGLTANTIDCDRTRWRAEIDPDAEAERWPVYARRAGVPRALREALEAGRRPMHWWVSEVPVRALTVERTP